MTRGLSRPKPPTQPCTYQMRPQRIRLSPGILNPLTSGALNLSTSPYGCRPLARIEPIALHMNQWCGVCSSIAAHRKPRPGELPDTFNPGYWNCRRVIGCDISYLKTFPRPLNRQFSGIQGKETPPQGYSTGFPAAATASVHRTSYRRHRLLRHGSWHVTRTNCKEYSVLSLNRALGLTKIQIHKASLTANEIM